MSRVFPVPGGTYTNDWGAPRSGGRGHEGIDIFAATGTPVLAVEDGVITAAGDDGGKGGIRIWLNGRFYFAHLSKLHKRTKVGAKVKAGQIIGYVGTSGNAKGTSPHLHFGFDPKGGQSAGDSWENPYPMLKSWASGKTEVTVEEDVGTTVVGSDIDAEMTRQQKIDTSLSNAAPPDPSVVVSGAMPAYPGTVQPSAPRPLAPQLETWRALSVLPNASPDTLRYLRMAELGYGEDGA